METNDNLREKRIVRILTNEFPMFFAIVTRLRQEISMIGADGGVIGSSVISQVQAVFPEGALQKRIKVGLQVNYENNAFDNHHTYFQFSGSFNRARFSGETTRQ